jgi:hypothetical protein
MDELVRPGRSIRGATTMKSFAKSPAVGIAFIVLANVTNAHAAGMPAHHLHRQPAGAGGMETKAMMMLKQVSSSFGGEKLLMSGNLNPADFLSQMQQ